ncbi:succinylglutamate-semialdehyde dehydrogenase [Capnocytophaga gingivalis]
MKITFPPYAIAEDLQKCMVIVREILDNKAITINEEHCQAIALEVMGISYAKGGDYSSETIKSFAEGYLKTVEI